MAGVSRVSFDCDVVTVSAPSTPNGIAARDAMPVDPWRLARQQSASFPDDSAHEACDETLFALANGALGVRGGLEEAASRTQATFLAGVWERVPIHYHERHAGFARHTDTRVPVADATAIRVRLGDAPLDAPGAQCLHGERVLELRQGRLFRSTQWRTARGKTLEIFADRVVPLAHPGLLCIRFRLRSIDYAGPLSLHSAILGAQHAAAQGDDPRVGAGVGLALGIEHSAANADGAHVTQHTRHSGIRVACAQAHRAVGEKLRFAAAAADAVSAHQVYTGTIAAGEQVVLEKYVAYAWTAPHQEEAFDSLIVRAAATLDTAFADGFDALAEAQANAFAAFWRGADLAIDGDTDAEQALRFNLFHIFQSASRDGNGGIAAKGLTGEGYEGHVFWDAETFVLPALAFSAPALVRRSLEYRFRALDRARAHAREMNHERGALYPWRTIAGDECSAHYPSGSAQYHINAAIAFAIKLYVEATEDTAFLIEAGAEMLFETARIWLDVGHFNPRRDGAFCIYGVTGPDEYTTLVNNNFYTNRMAQEHLRYAVVVARQLAAESPTIFAALNARLELDGTEIEQWSRAAKAMYLPYDEKLGIFAQDDEFLDKPLWDFAATPREHYPLLMHYHPLTIYRHQVSKQADVVLALVLAGGDVDRERKRRNFDYYERITVHDSTLSASTFGILAAEIGYSDTAYRYFRETLRVDLDDLHRNTGHGAHMAAMAGSWLTLIWGFGGLRRNEGRLAFDPTLPRAWRSYRFGLAWKNRRLRIEIDASSARYTLVDGKPIEIEHAGSRIVLAAGSSQVMALSNVAPPPPIEGAPDAFPRAFKAVIFDLDGVLADTAQLHHAAWKRLAGEAGLPFDDSIGESLKGVDRDASLEIVLGGAAHKYTTAQKRELADRKNSYYRASVEHLGPQHLLPGAYQALAAAHSAGLKIGLASASRSARLLVERMGVADLFDSVADAAAVTHAKPHPEIFLMTAAALGVAPTDCLGIEDAAAGIAAIKAAGMTALGVGDARVLAKADAVLPDLTRFNLRNFVAPPRP